jgi:hypothetical protein
MIFVRSKHSQKFVGSCVVFTSAAVILNAKGTVKLFLAMPFVAVGRVGSITL